MVDLVNELASDLRELDRIEIEATGVDVSTAIETSIRLSQRLYTKRDTSGRLLLVGGAGRQSANADAFVWMLGTNALKDYPMKVALFGRELKAVKDTWVQEFGVLSNFVFGESKESIKWITYLGAEWNGTLHHNGKRFIHFSFRK